MASFVKRKGPHGHVVWQARVERKDWPRQYATFDSKLEAEEWATTIEFEMLRGVFVSRREAETTALAEALKRYRDEITPKKRGAAQERSRIAKCSNTLCRSGN